MRQGPDADSASGPLALSLGGGLRLAGDVPGVLAVGELVLDLAVLTVHDHLTQRCRLRQLLGVLNGEVFVVPGAQLALVLVTAGPAQRPTVDIGHDVVSLAGTHRGVLPDLRACYAPQRRVPRRHGNP